MSDFQASTESNGGRVQAVLHQPENSRFVSIVDGAEAVLDYRMLSAKRIDFNHTFVPNALRGRGIAETLVRTGLAWARHQDLQIQASCWYVQRFMRT